MAEFIKISISKRVAILLIDREKALNAMNNSALFELDIELKALIENDNIGAIIITGSEEKSFIAGADIKIMSTLDKKQHMISQN